jgi:predicted ATPase/class 3 adenylate cyclase
MLFGGASLTLRWATMNVAEWLRTLGLERYERAFRENEIDEMVLRRLTAEDLKDLGVTLVGHRRRLLDAIAALADADTAPRGAPASPAGNDPSQGDRLDTAPIGGERRQLTVMFCDLVGSTALSNRLDLEDLREIIGAYHKRVAKVIGRFDGFVAKYMGDGVLAYFGYPQAHEDDAERAVRAGLKLATNVHRLGLPADSEPLQIRVGIATGLVVVGDLIGSGAAQEQTVVGETPNLAARLQALAEPNAVVIAASTRRLLGGLFDYDDLGAVEMKGYAEPVRAWCVRGRSTAESRYEALHSAVEMTPLVGREEELDLLLRRWQQAKSGSGRTVVFSGEPGIGKSRITAAFQERLQAEPHTRLRFFCSPYHQNSALHPVITQLERAAAFERDDTPAMKLDKLAALLALASPPEEDVALLAELLAIPTAGRYQPLNLTPPRRKEMTFEALLRQIERLGRQRPVLLIYEDVHWIDPSSRELLDLTVERVPRLPVLLLVTSRPGFQPAWTDQAHVSVLALNRLGRREGGALVEQIAVADGNPLPKEIVDEIVERTDGVPLFVEELTRAVLEAGAARADGLIATALPSALSVPATLQASLMARLDRLGPAAKEVAQIGAAIGREFPYQLLTAAARRGDAELQAALGRLVDAGLISCRGALPQATFLFKHALVQDTAYGTLLRGNRHALHARIGAALEERFPGTAETQPEILAHHFAQAEQGAKAADYWHRAGRVALARSAVPEAVAQLRKGLAVLEKLSDGAERQQRELDLQMTLGGALIAAKGYAAPQTGAAFARARELCSHVGDATTTFRVLYGEFAYLTVKGELIRADDATREFLRLAQRDGSSDVLVIGHRSVAVTSFLLGRLTIALTHLEQALAFYEPAKHRSLASLYGFDPRAVALAWLSLLLLVLGHGNAALSRSREALAAAQEVAHPATRAYALNHAVQLHQLLGDGAAVEELSADLLSLTGEQGFPFWSAAARMQRGWLMTIRGDSKGGAAQIGDGLAAYRNTGSDHMMPYYFALHADACVALGQISEGLSLIEQGLAAVARTDERWYEAEMYRLKGDLLLAIAQPDAADAQTCFRHAIAIAREQGAKLWELRATSSLARLWREQGKRTEARDLLAPIHGWFTDGFDTRDLNEAKALLNELEEARPHPHFS